MVPYGAKCVLRVSSVQLKLKLPTKTVADSSVEFHCVLSSDPRIEFCLRGVGGVLSFQPPPFDGVASAKDLAEIS